MERTGSAISDQSIVVFTILMGGMIWLFTWLPSLGLRQEIGDWLVPGQYETMQNPIELSDAVLQDAREQYLFTCAKCHGYLAEGDGPQYQLLIPRPLPWGSSRVQNQTDGSMFYKIFVGRGDMPAYGHRTTEEEIWELIHYIRQIPNLPGHYNRTVDPPVLNAGAALSSRIGTTVTPIPLDTSSR